MLKVVFVRSGGNYDMDAASVEAGLDCRDESLAVQASRDETDINVIVRRFGITGQLPVGVVPPMYGDFTDVMDFTSAMNVVAKANEAFDAMPAEVRARFVNDPSKFLEFVYDDKNRDEAVRLGLVLPPVKVVEAVPSAPAGPGAIAPAPGGV